MKGLIAITAVLLIVGVSPAVAQEVPGQDALVGYFPLNGNVLDESGHGNNGILHGSFTDATGRNGNPNSARFFDGDDDFIEIPTSDTFRIDGEMTVSFWLNRESHQNPAAGNGDGFVLSMDAVATFGRSPLHVSLSSDTETGALARLMVNNSPVFDVPLGEWVHFVIAVSGRSLTVYMNGEIVVQGALPGTIMSDSRPLWVGSYGGVDFDYHGAMDDLMIFNRALTEEEIGGLAGVSLEPEPEEDCIPLSQIPACEVCEQCQICEVCPEVVCEECPEVICEECPQVPEVICEECPQVICEECVECEACPKYDCFEANEVLVGAVGKAKMYFDFDKDTTSLRMHMNVAGIPEGPGEGPVQFRLQIIQNGMVTEFVGDAEMDDHGRYLMKKHRIGCDRDKKHWR